LNNTGLYSCPNIYVQFYFVYKFSANDNNTPSMLGPRIKHLWR